MTKKLIIITLSILLNGCGGGSDPNGGGSGTSGGDVAAGLLGAAIIYGVVNYFDKNHTSNNNASNITSSVTTLDDASDKYFNYIYGHNFTPITKLGDEKDDYGLYTYILFNKKVSEEGLLSSEYRKKCQIILEKTQQYLPSSVKNSFGHDKLNNFLIPSVAKKPSIVSLKNYGFNLSMKVMDTLSKMAMESKSSKFDNNTFSHEGPFIITTTEPLQNTGNEVYFIYADLTDINVAATEEIINTYVSKLEDRKSGDKPFTRLASIRASLLKYLVDFNESIKLVRYAVAG